MISRWKHALIFSLLLLPAAVQASGMIREVTYTGMSIVPYRELERGALLKGAAYSDSAMDSELARIDSLCFSYGLLATSVTVDTFVTDGSVAVRIDLSEGEPATIGSLSLGGVKSIGPDEAARVLRVGEGNIFDPVALEAGLGALLGRYNDEGFPYAQVWLTGFTYDRYALARTDLKLSLFQHFQRPATLVKLPRQATALQDKLSDRWHGRMICLIHIPKLARTNCRKELLSRY